MYDFIDPALGKAIPYGVYDVGCNEGWGSVGGDHDTSEFAVESIRRWWRNMGSVRYPQASKLLITADGGGGSSSSRCHLWKWCLSQLSTETRLEEERDPPGTEFHRPPAELHWMPFLGTGLLRIYGGSRQGNRAALHPATTGRG